VQIPQPSNPRMGLAQRRKEIRFEFIVSSARAVGMKRHLSRIRHVGDHIPILVMMAKEGHGELETLELVRQRGNPAENAVVQAKCFHPLKSSKYSRANATQFAKVCLAGCHCTPSRL
jgi:hypothetical protein